ncbi:hypothetical protein J7337_012651 [Fusarium musae]|uniref:Rhodopsin domain-containing protein n=1 Tax=Fusarium musae TaxID=1042133 RepID=A0A9P8D681_9HYPO|nr:hypothetical protein J7337_012651 [Fusarium musae]KAG9496075.1 hypothetical protein J7337_012651 [Fusarium musae]
MSRIIGSKIQVAGWTIYSALIWSLKLSMLYFYTRLTTGLGRSYRIRIYVGFGLVIGTFIATIIAIFAGCQPFHKYWQINPDPGTNISTDIYLIAIPLPMLWGSSLKMIKKIASTIVLGAGSRSWSRACWKLGHSRSLCRRNDNQPTDPLSALQGLAHANLRKRITLLS